MKPQIHKHALRTLSLADFAVRHKLWRNPSSTPQHLFSDVYILLVLLKLGCETPTLDKEAVALRYNRSEPLNPSSPACEYPQVYIKLSFTTV